MIPNAARAYSDRKRLFALPGKAGIVRKLGHNHVELFVTKSILVVVRLFTIVLYIKV